MSVPSLERYTLGPVDQVPVGEGRRFECGGRSIAVYRWRDGTLTASDDHCPHRGGPLSEGILGGGQVICPYHSYRFDLRTGACLNDTSCRLTVYEVEAVNGEILVTLE